MKKTPLSQSSIDALADIIRHQQSIIDAQVRQHDESKHDTTIDHDFCRGMDGTYDPIKSLNDVIDQKKREDRGGGIAKNLLKAFGPF